MFYKLNYFKQTQGEYISGHDLDNGEENELININQISSLSDIKQFFLPLSGRYQGDYAVLSMQNGDRFYINVKSHQDINDYLNKKKTYDEN